jgi:hypothetical protein
MEYRMTTNQTSQISEAVSLEEGEVAPVGSFYHRITVQCRDGFDATYDSFKASVQTEVDAKRALADWVLIEWANGYCPPSGEDGVELDFRDASVVSAYLLTHTDEEIIDQYFANDDDNSYEIERCVIQPFTVRTFNPELVDHG